MDRTIKFRAWDTKLKRWNLSVEIDCFGNIQEYKYNGSAFYQKYKSDYECSIDLENGNKRFILVQFTGLYDCEGKEVYMGDIIEGTFQLRKQDPVEFISPVDFSVLWGATVEGDDVYSLGRCRNIKLIGNIYEHPHLLNNESNT